MATHRLDIRESGYFRQLDGILRGTRMERSAEQLTTHRGVYAVIERGLVDGRLPDPEPADSQGEWLDEHQWDFLVYLQSTAKAKYGGLSYPGVGAAKNHCGLHADLPKGAPGVNKVKRLREGRLLARLVDLGFIEFTEGPYQNESNTLVWLKPMLAPTWRPGCKTPSPSGIAKSITSLEDNKRSWFMMPADVFTKGPWKQAPSHQDRRVIAAVYCFYDEKTYEAVNPNHLCIRGDHFELSDEFLLACGGQATPESVIGTLAWLRSKHWLFLVRHELQSGRPHPAGSHYVTWSRPVAKHLPSDVTAFVPLYLPKEKTAV